MLNFAFTEFSEVRLETVRKGLGGTLDIPLPGAEAVLSGPFPPLRTR
jgi:hypothetical protein